LLNAFGTQAPAFPVPKILLPLRLFFLLLLRFPAYRISAFSTLAFCPGPFRCFDKDWSFSAAHTFNSPPRLCFLDEPRSLKSLLISFRYLRGAGDPCRRAVPDPRPLVTLLSPLSSTVSCPLNLLHVVRIGCLPPPLRTYSCGRSLRRVFLCPLLSNRPPREWRPEACFFLTLLSSATSLRLASARFVPCPKKPNGAMSLRSSSSLLPRWFPGFFVRRRWALLVELTFSPTRLLESPFLRFWCLSPPV